MAAHLLCGLGRLCILSVQAGGNGLNVFLPTGSAEHTHTQTRYTYKHTHTAVVLIYSETKRCSCTHTRSGTVLLWLLLTVFQLYCLCRGYVSLSPEPRPWTHGAWRKSHSPRPLQLRVGFPCRPASWLGVGVAPRSAIIKRNCTVELLKLAQWYSAILR